MAPRSSARVRESTSAASGGAASASAMGAAIMAWRLCCRNHDALRFLRTGLDDCCGANGFF